MEQAEQLTLEKVIEMLLKGQYAGLTENGGLPPKHEDEFLSMLAKAAEQYNSEYIDAKPENPDDAGKPIDAKCKIGVSSTHMEAMVFIFPPAFGGKEPTAESLQAAINEAKVRYGSDAAVLMELITEKKYGRVITFAKGKTQVNGTDGTVVEKFQREKTISIAKNDEEKVDYRNLNWVQQVHKGDEICQIIRPTLGEDGVDVLGNPIRAAEGRTPIVPMGKNTVVDEERSALVAACDGQISFHNQAWQVEQVLEIKGDVDNSVGNLDAIGSVNILGNVQEGFTIKATGDITVKGVVEGAFLESAHNITIRGGLKGNMRATIKAKGDIRCKYIENATLTAGGNISSDSVVNSKLYSNNRIEVLSGRGVIVGGEAYAREAVCAKVIGNEHNVKITLSVGTAPDYWENKKRLSDEVEKLRREIDEAEKNIRFLEQQGELPDDYKQLLSDLRLKITVQKMQHVKKEKTLQKLISDQNPQGSRIQAATLYPPVYVQIGKVTRIFQSNEKMCNIYLSDGEIISGQK